MWSLEASVGLSETSVASTDSLGYPPWNAIAVFGEAVIISSTCFVVHLPLPTLAPTTLAPTVLSPVPSACLISERTTRTRDSATPTAAYCAHILAFPALLLPLLLPPPARPPGLLHPSSPARQRRLSTHPAQLHRRPFDRTAPAPATMATKAAQKRVSRLPAGFRPPHAPSPTD